MKTKIIADRVAKFDYHNRFADFYQVESQVEPILNFGIGEDTALVDDGVKELLAPLIGDSKNYGYSENIAPGLQKAFAAFADREYGVHLEPAEISPTGGIKDTLNLLAYLLVNPGDQIVVTNPGYNVFERAALHLGARIISLDLDVDDGGVSNIAAELKQRGLQPKIVMCNYPNNPTGRSVELSFWVELSAYVNSYGGIVINDAAYLDYTYAHPPVSLLAVGRRHLLELYSASKTFGLTGERVGAIAGDRQLIAALEMIRDQFNSGSSPLFLTLYRELLKSRNTAINRHRYQRRYLEVAPILSAHGFEVPALDSTFYLFLKAPKNRLTSSGEALKIAAALKEKAGVITIPYQLKSGPYLRLSLTYKREEDPKILEQRLAKFVDLA